MEVPFVNFIKKHTRKMDENKNAKHFFVNFYGVLNDFCHIPDGDA